MRCAAPLLAAFLLALAACGEGPPVTPDGPPPPPPKLVVINMCPETTPPFTALHIHSAIDNYRGTTNHLEQPLKVGESTLITAISSGSWYVTAIREKLDHSATVAMTTATPLQLRSGVYRLGLFQQSFRLYAPEDAGVPPREAGLRELGSDRGREAGPRELGGDRGREAAPLDLPRGELGADGTPGDLPRPIDGGGNEGSVDAKIIHD